MPHHRRNDAPADFANYVLVLQPIETLVQFYVVKVVIVPLGEEQLVLRARRGLANAASRSQPTAAAQY